MDFEEAKKDMDDFFQTTSYDKHASVPYVPEEEEEETTQTLDEVVEEMFPFLKGA